MNEEMKKIINFNDEDIEITTQKRQKEQDEKLERKKEKEPEK